MIRRKVQSRILVLCVLIALATVPALAQDPSYKADILADLAQLEEKIVGLAEAIPADKYSWSPSDGVRTASQALMHTASANYFFPTLLGAAPAGKGNLEAITDKSEAVTELKGSFAHLKKSIEGVDEGSLDETVDMFGRKATKAGVLHATLSHNHEHLGQMIAYARSIGVTPPWSQ
ncbi:MAG TPA: DinB family protein [Thermoanaerobaculia bacterium]|nr:DinB family protein [Thermoanaerobaculia bacterium]